MRFVATKTPEQRSCLMLHRTRHLFVRQQTAVINAIRAHLAEKVRTCYGETRTVLFQNGCQVFVEEECNGWYHPTKVWATEAKTF
jgi:transposase